MQKITVLLIGAIGFVFSTSQLSAQNLDKELETIIAPLITSISGQSVKNIAIADFTLLDGTPTELGKYLAEEFTYSLVSAPKKTFGVIDRSRVSALLKENNLGSTGIVDPNTIVKLGKMKGIDAVIAGILTSTGNTIRLNIKVWNLETQNIVAVSRGDISKTPMIIELEGKTVSGGIGGNIGGGAVTSKTPVNLPVIAKVTNRDVTYELLECKQLGQTIRCVFQAKSEVKDVKLNIYGRESTFILDGNTGKEFYAESVTIADKTGNGSHGGAIKSIISGYPVKLIIEFGSVNIPVSMISKLVIYDNGNKVEFRNIKVK